MRGKQNIKIFIYVFRVMLRINCFVFVMKAHCVIFETVTRGLRIALEES